jgi:hypothetical protein
MEINRVDGGGLAHEGGENGCPLTGLSFDDLQDEHNGPLNNK